MTTRKQPILALNYGGHLVPVAGYQCSEEPQTCETCWSDSHETHECPLNADQFVDPGEC